MNGYYEIPVVKKLRLDTKINITFEKILSFFH